MLDKRKKYHVIQITEIILFMGILIFFMAGTGPIVLRRALDDHASEDFSGWSDEVPALQSCFKENLVLKDNLTDLASISDVTFSRIYTDNYTYLKDVNGMVYHLKNDTSQPELIHDMVSLQQYVNEQGLDTRILYVQNPLRIDTAVKYHPNDFTNVDEYAQRAKEILDAGNVDILDIKETSNAYFATDMHATTQSQVDAMYQIAEYIEKNSEIDFQYKNLLDINNSDLYDKKAYHFVGGYCRSIGGFYTHKDIFRLYIPRFDTDYVIDFLNTGEQVTGNFSDVLVKIPEKYDSRTYWITNMAYYGQSLYSIKNRAMDGEPRVLFIMDSAPMSGICYLSTVCSELCVYDPRFSEGDADRKWLKEHIGDYDFVVCDTLENSMDYMDIFD